MNHSRKGFTVIELVIVILIGSILATIAMGQFGEAQNRFAIQGAQNQFISFHARARAMAIESGKTVKVHWDHVGDSAWITRGDTILESVNFQSRYRVDLVGSGSGSNPWTLCLTSRGYADSDCNSFSSMPNLDFKLQGLTSRVTVLPLGQLVF